MYAYVRRFFVVLVLVGLALSTAQAEDAPALEARLYRVGALTAGSIDFLPHAFPLVSPDMVSDEENPLFGAEAQEPRWPFGQVDDLVKLLCEGVSPSFWEDVEDAEISSFGGESLLLVRATPAIHDELGAFLAALERRALSTLTIDVQTVRIPVVPGRGRLVLDDAATAALLKRSEIGPAVRFTALPGQRAFAFDGAEIAYLQDGDVEVQQSAPIVNPIIGVLSAGLSAAVRASSWPLLVRTTGP